MEDRGGYGQFCPVAMASEILCSRWTMLVVRELLCGIDAVQRPAARRAAHVARAAVETAEGARGAGVILAARGPSGGKRISALAEPARTCAPVVMGIGLWGQRWVESRFR